MDEMIVPTNVAYNSFLLTKNLIALNRKFPFLNIQIVGNSVTGLSIPVIRLGNGPKQVFYSASIHANEWITSVVLMKFIEEYCQAYQANQSLYGYSIPNLFRSTSIYIMPMVNPDGVNLVTGYFTPNQIVYQKAEQIARQFPEIPFPDGWKANNNGVDFKI